MKIQLSHSFQEIISLENLFLAWQEFVHGKGGALDAQIFAHHLSDNIVSLHEDLKTQKYIHGPYQKFSIADPKPRVIHKASVRDRLLHHAMHRVLYPFFNRTFIADSFSCRITKGTHAALKRFKAASFIVSQNNTKTCWILKCDIRKFFHSIHHETLLNILTQYIREDKTIWLLKQLITSFSSYEESRGLPLGNLTSQLFANIYMNVFDQFVKHKLKAHYYIRYADDFIIFSRDYHWLQEKIPEIKEFLWSKLKLTLHPDKIWIGTLASGIDFLGWVNFSDHRVLRSATKRKMFRRIKEHPTNETLQSYLGLLRHGNTFSLRETLLLSNWLWQD